jgi:uncharacterized protein
MKINIDEVKEFISKQSKQTKIYFGADSERVNVNDRWMVDYLLVIAVHIDGKHGGKVFGEVQREMDYDKKLDRPKTRLMTEVYKLSELYLQFAEFLEDMHVEIHLDLNPMPIHGSSCAVAEAIGYIKGVCGIDPVVKPNAWAATTVADSAKRILS